jgi:hypothetical protein
VIPLTEDKLYLREHVCANCPGSQWGKTTKCSIHNIHIGKVDSCPQWEQLESPKIKDHDGQLAIFDLEPAMEIVQKVEEDLKDYHWMVREIKRLYEALNDAGEKLVAQYGIESAMPKAKGGNSNPVEREASRRSREWQRLEKLQKKVMSIDAAVIKIEDDKERTVLECMLDGERMNMISKHVGVSRQRLNEIKRDLVKRLAWELYPEELKRL